MNILITGGNGFLARGMAGPLSDAGHTLRQMDCGDFETEYDRIQGDVAVLDDVRRALDGMDAVIICHMAPRNPNAYETPEMCFKINVTGTANILHLAQEGGIQKAVIISTSTTNRPEDPMKWITAIPLPATKGLYELTKSCQETIGMHYAAAYNMQIALLRVGYIVDADHMQDKYGRTVNERAPLDCDRRDVGEAARLFLEKDLPGLSVFPVMSTFESLSIWGAQHTIDTLGWIPRFDFDRLPLPAKKDAP